MTAEKRLGTGHGHALALGTILIWGTTFIASAVVLRTLTPIEMMTLRMLIAILALTAAYPRRLKLKERRHELYLLGAALTGVTLYYLFESLALTLTYPANCSVIVSTAPFFVAIATRILQPQEKLTRSFFAGFAVAMAGVCLVSFAGQSLHLNPLGDGLCVLAAMCWGGYSVFVHKLEGYGYSTLLITRRILLYGLLLMLPLTPVLGYSIRWEDISAPATLGCLLFLGLVASALCFVTWNTAVRLIGPVKTSAYIYLTPCVTIVFSWLVLNDPIEPLAVAGAALTLLGLILSQRR